MIKTEILTESDLQKAAGLLREGELVAFPTETVYGLGADALNPDALRKIFVAKNRPSDNPLILHLYSLSQLEALNVDIPRELELLASHFIPGPLTLVLRQGDKTVAVRWPMHPVALELLKIVGRPIAAPSANLSGRPSATTSAHVLEDLGGKIAAVIDGGVCEKGVESTVLSLTDPVVPRVLRPGAISKEAIEKVLGKKIGEADAASSHQSPGMRYRHYAPSVPVVLVGREQLKKYESEKGAYAVFSRQLIDLPNSWGFFSLDISSFYSNLRKAEKAYQAILIVCDKMVEEDATLWNRIVKASG